MPLIGVLPRLNWIIGYDHRISVEKLEAWSKKGGVILPISFPYHDSLHNDT